MRHATTDPGHDNRFTVSDLANFQYFVENDYQQIDELVRRIRRVDDKNARALEGIRIHEMLERAARGVPGALEELHDTCEVWVDVRLRRPEVAEMHVDKIYEIGGRRIKLVGRVDGAYDKTIVDYKTTKTIDLETIHHNIQWRCYLDMLPAYRVFRHDVFHLRKPRGAKKYIIDEHRPFELWRYPTLGADVLSKVQTYDEFLTDLARDGWIELTAYGPKRARRR